MTSAYRKMEETILEVKNLNVELEGEEILKDLSFKVKKGEVLTILGPNGAGKSTLLKALLEISKYQGVINWKKGVKVSYLPDRLSREEFKIIPLSIKEFLGFEKASTEKIKEMLNSVGLEPARFLNKQPGDLSSGEFQRMLIAQALISEPNVLLFDEPTGGIDVGGKETIYSLLHQLWKEKNLTILLVTHEINVVYAYSTNVLCLSRKKLCYGKPEKVLTPETLKELYGNKIRFYKHH